MNNDTNNQNLAPSPVLESTPPTPEPIPNVPAPVTTPSQSTEPVISPVSKINWKIVDVLLLALIIFAAIFIYILYITKFSASA